ncbi:MAG: type II toxin-antitoxin system RelE/ParE family toxin [Anaerolineae bacterium]
MRGQLRRARAPSAGARRGRTLSQDAACPPGANRFFYFAYVDRRFVILHAYRKQSQKTPPQELALAERRLAEVLTGGIEDG